MRVFVERGDRGYVGSYIHIKICMYIYIYRYVCIYVCMGVSENQAYHFGRPHNRDYSIVFWGLHWGPLILGNCHLCTGMPKYEV